jgi:hypothetical protein
MTTSTTGPWNLPCLQAQTSFDEKNARVVRDFDRATRISEIYFDVEPFLSRPARAFGYLAMPADPDSSSRRCC